MAQNSPEETYVLKAGGYAAVYSGKLSSPYPAYYTNHPFLVSDAPAEGSLWYDGVYYANVRMKFDCYRDELVVRPPDTNNDFALHPAYLDSVRLHGYKIVYYRPDGLSGAPAEGYYLALYEGGCVLLEQQTRSLSETRRGESVSGSFRSATRYYLRYGNAWHTVKNKNSLLSVFSSHRKELSQYIKTHRLKFGSKNAEASIVAVVREYERIKH
ncbi:MAG: hypothetical protein LBR50_05385 [Tannerella sp.]|jgi:hypothetical protein|nr:hypothetical protein [Tannerella sp.]